MKFEHEIKVGAFVITSSIILVFVILWLHRFDISTNLIMYAKFEDAGTLGIGSTVLYRGVKAGNVKDIDISDDQKYALVKISISNKEIQIFEGSSAVIVDKGFTGTKALVIEPPEVITNKKPLKDGAIIEGKQSFNYEEFQKLLTKLLEENKFEQLVDDTHLLILNSNKTSEELNRLMFKIETIINDENSHKVNVFLANTSDMSQSLKRTSDNLNNIISDKKLQQEVKEAVSATNKAMNKLDNTITKSDELVSKADKVLDRTQTTVKSMDKVLTTFDNEINDSIKEAMNSMNQAFKDIHEITSDEEVKKNFKSAITEYKDNVNSFKCFGEEMSRTFSKPFLVPRMIIGQPGKNLKGCYKQQEKAVTNE
jgi:ABC-type transporter Mla subunit MlaD